MSGSLLAVHESVTAPLAGAAVTPVGAAGGVFAAVTVHVKVSAGAVAVPSVTLTETLYVPQSPLRGAADDARRRCDRDARGQVGGAVGERVAVEIGCIGVDAAIAAPVVSLRSARFVLKTGAVLTTVTGSDVTGALSTVPSLTVTRTRMRSPWSPLPARPRSRVAPVAPTMSRPLRVHW